MDERDFARFEFKMSFGRITYIAQHPSAALIKYRAKVSNTVTSSDHWNVFRLQKNPGWYNV